MRTVHKATIPMDAIDDTVFLRLPAGSKILHAQEQRSGSGIISIWYECDHQAEFAFRKVAIRGTGHEVPHDTSAFIGTVVTCSGDLVWHLYDLGEEQH